MVELRPLAWWRALVAATAVLAVVAVVARLVDHLLDDRPGVAPAVWASFLDLNTEANLPTFVATFLALAVAATTAVRALAAAGAVARAWWTLALVAVAVAADEAAGVHERFLEPVGDRLGGGEGALAFAWVVPGAALAVLGVIVLVRATRPLPSAIRRALAVAVAVFLAGALGAETVSAVVLDDRGDRSAYLAVTTVEEVLELAGVLLALRAVLDGLVLRRDGRSLAVVVDR